MLYTLLFFSFRWINWDGESYTGGYKQGYWNGKGMKDFEDGSRLIAYYVDNHKEGEAKYYYKNGKKEERFYKKDKLVKH